MLQTNSCRGKPITFGFFDSSGYNDLRMILQKLKNRTSDITRGTVQKSVCVLSTLPLYGHIQVKMALITHAYFDEGDFSKVSLLEDTYHHLNACMSTDSQIPPQIFVGEIPKNYYLFIYF